MGRGDQIRHSEGLSWWQVAAHPHLQGWGLKKGALEGRVPLSYCRLLLRGNVGSLLLALPFFQEKSELLIYARSLYFEVLATWLSYKWKPSLWATSLRSLFWRFQDNLSLIQALHSGYPGNTHHLSLFGTGGKVSTSPAAALTRQFSVNMCWACWAKCDFTALLLSSRRCQGFTESLSWNKTKPVDFERLISFHVELRNLLFHFGLWFNNAD